MATTPPRRTQAERSSATRRAILDAALALFHERGVRDVSVDEIAEHAGLTKGAVYHHFGGKPGVLDALLESVQIGELADPTVIGDTGLHDALDRWGAAVAAADAASADEAALDAELWFLAMTDESMRRRLAGGYAETRRRLGESIERWTGGRELAVRPDQLATLLVALAHGLSEQRRLDPAAIPSSAFVELAQVVARGASSTEPALADARIRPGDGTTRPASASRAARARQRR